MDDPTLSAFGSLWKLWKDNQDIKDNSEAWAQLSADIEKIWNAAQGAKDPEFIREFCLSVICSLHRISVRNN